MLIGLGTAPEGALKPAGNDLRMNLFLNNNVMIKRILLPIGQQVGNNGNNRSCQRLGGQGEKHIEAGMEAKGLPDRHLHKLAEIGHDCWQEGQQAEGEQRTAREVGHRQPARLCGLAQS